METLPKLIGLHTSPFTERARWAFDHKKARYERVAYRIAAGEEELYALSGQRQVPVLVVGDEAIPDSTAILDWLEQRSPEPPLLPEDPTLEAQVRLLEDIACGALAPQARLLLVGRMLSSNEESAVRLGRFFAKKYGHSDHAERSARGTVRRVARTLTAALGGRSHFVGDAFTRADLTVAAMLLVVCPPPEEFFVCSPPWTRVVFEDPLRGESEIQPLFAWRDTVYRRHRGGQVRP
jgi:glutathione S-transferase